MRCTHFTRITWYSDKSVTHDSPFKLWRKQLIYCHKVTFWASLKPSKFTFHFVCIIQSFITGINLSFLLFGEMMHSKKAGKGVAIERTAIATTFFFLWQEHPYFKMYGPTIVYFFDEHGAEKEEMNFSPRKQGREESICSWTRCFKAECSISSLKSVSEVRFWAR